MHAPIRETTPAVRERTPPAVRASPTAWRRLLRGAALAAVVGLFMAAVGAFGSGIAPAVVRYPYWVAMMLLGAVGGSLTSRLIGEHRFRQKPRAMSLVMIVVSTIWMTPVIWYCTTRVYGLPQHLRQMAWFIPPVLLVSVAMTVLSYLLHDRAPTVTHAAPEGAPPPRFLERLPVKLRGSEIWAVQAEDHYLRIHTSRGSDLILMRLSDAIAELAGLEGAQTHRSWWVAKDAVLDAARGDGRATLRLKGGIEAPVSRTFAPALRQARWW